MSDIIDFIQSYWFELGSLTLQLAVLAVVLTYGRKALRLLSVPLAATRAASQAQVELLQDLQDLSETRGSRPPVEPAEPRAAVYGGVGRMLSPMPTAPAEIHAEPAVSVRRERRSPWHALAVWLKAPIRNRPAPQRRSVLRQVS